ncbi:hypothetical protein DFH08DRAFT_870744 [Mycena albidolilacea]|uniref:Uncharacterized protein n=1 Tax=Mycena albidolilacea TaxID=1033008 RepID=A0AAD7ER13_9AGAR|nr:hypothetical protein DFH08DRAFT_870744 [Mycena albidolilacea]
MLKQRYPHIGLCAEHWKAHRLIQGRYRFWAAGPFRDRLVTYDAPNAPPGALLPPPPAAPSAARKRVADDPLESEHAKRQQLFEDESLIHMSLPPGDTVPPPNTDRFTNPEQARDTEVDPAATGGTPPVQPDMLQAFCHAASFTPTHALTVPISLSTYLPLCPRPRLRPTELCLYLRCRLPLRRARCIHPIQSFSLHAIFTRPSIVQMWPAPKLSTR